MQDAVWLRLQARPLLPAPTWTGRAGAGWLPGNASRPITHLHGCQATGRRCNTLKTRAGMFLFPSCCKSLLRSCRGIWFPSSKGPHPHPPQPPTPSPAPSPAVSGQTGHSQGARPPAGKLPLATHLRGLEKASSEELGPSA